jgi:hypothetical protein
VTARIKDRVTKTIETARTMRDFTKVAGLTALEVPYNAEACEAFGGCPFKEKCNLSAQERIESIMSQGNAQGNLLDQLRAKRNSNKQPAAAAPPQPVNPPEAGASAAPAAASPSDMLERLRQERAQGILRRTE